MHIFNIMSRKQSILAHNYSDNYITLSDIQTFKAPDGLSLMHIFLIQSNRPTHKYLSRI